MIGKADSCPHKTLLQYCTTEIPELFDKLKKVDLATRDVKNNALRINMKLNKFEEDIRPRQVKCDQDTAKMRELLDEHTIILDRQGDVVNNLVKASLKELVKDVNEATDEKLKAMVSKEEKEGIDGDILAINDELLALNVGKQSQDEAHEQLGKLRMEVQEMFQKSQSANSELIKTLRNELREQGIQIKEMEVPENIWTKDLIKSELKDKKSKKTKRKT